VPWNDDVDVVVSADVLVVGGATTAVVAGAEERLKGAVWRKDSHALSFDADGS